MDGQTDKQTNNQTHRAHSYESNAWHSQEAESLVRAAQLVAAALTRPSALLILTKVQSTACNTMTTALGKTNAHATLRVYIH